MTFPPPTGGRHGPFGDKAFKAALVACAVMVLAGSAMVTGRGSMAAVGAAFLALGGLGLATGGLGLLAERRIERRASRPPETPRTD
jgi:hypothetical protein